jgi:purine catabolism regulator
LVTDDATRAFTQDLESLDAGSPGMVRAVLEDGPVILTETRHLPALRRLMLAYQVPTGVSDRGPLSDLTSLLSQANRALEHSLANDAEAPVDYVPALHDGVLHLLSDNPEAVRHATDLLAPIRNHDRRHSDSIEESLRTWLSHHGQTSPAAAELGVHRHTLRARVQTAANLLQSDLDSPDTRAELWAALRLLADQHSL